MLLQGLLLLLQCPVVQGCCCKRQRCRLLAVLEVGLAA